MRALFVIVVLANVAFFVWARYVAPPEAAADPLPVGRQLEPEKLKVVSPTEVAALSTRPPPAAAPIALKCLEWGSFALADVPHAQSALEPLGLGARITQRRSEDSAGWWVFIPPQGSRPAALKKVAELKALAIDDYFILQDEGPNRWAVSLGVFRTEEAAQARLDSLRNQGVRSAQMAARGTAAPKIWLQMKGIDATLQARVTDIAHSIEGTELRDCPQ